MQKRLPLVRTIVRLLTFRLDPAEAKRLDARFLLVGLAGTWLVGIGRYWDDPEASFGQYMGLGSLAYVFILALILFGIARPFRPENWSYVGVLTFLTLTSFPAGLYAIPVERWVPVEVAIQLNVAFLALVALYRVALYLFWMRRMAGLGAMAALSAVFLPITLIVAFITVSGYAGVVFDIMGGFRGRQPTADDGVNDILLGITLTSCISLPVWGALYVASLARHLKRRAESAAEGGP